MNEAKGGWLLKQARETEPATGHRNLIPLSAPRAGYADRSAVSSTLIYVRYKWENEQELKSGAATICS
jgi:hypothetical protein